MGLPLLFRLDVIHGYRTVYPLALAEAGTFNPDLMKKTARMAARESHSGGVAWDFAPMQESFGMALPEILGAKSLEELRAKSTEEVFAATDKFMGANMPVAKGLFLVPTIDGHLLTDGYYPTIDKGEIKDLPYMIGSTKEDIMVEPGKNSPEERPLYRGSVAFSQKLEELGRKPAYVYDFLRDLPGDEQGAWHSAELWYMMGTMGRCWRPWTAGDYALSARMLDYWCNFMRTGDPNGEGLPKWEPCGKEKPFVMELDIPSG